MKKYNILTCELQDMYTEYNCVDQHLSRGLNHWNVEIGIVKYFEDIFTRLFNVFKSTAEITSIR